MAAVQEITLKFRGDASDLQRVMAAVRSDLARLSQAELAGVRNASRQTVVEATRAERQRVAETIRSANQRLREEQRAAREVARITAETARQGAAQERIRERAAKQLADVQIREAKRAARELERSIAASRSSGGDAGGGDIANIASQIPLIGRYASQLSVVTSSATAAGGAIASIALPIAAVTVAATAGAAVLALLGKTLFDVTKQAAEFEGKFRDLSQQVGVSAETLSTLDFFASTTGGNIDTVTASLGIFQKNLEAAHDPTSKEAKLLKELGVTSLDTETALRQTIAGLFRLGEGSKQTSSALELFGRSGRFVNAITKEAGGNFEEAGKQAAKFGRLVTTEGAIAADLFNDSLVILSGQLAAIGRQLVTDTIPVFIVFFQDLSIALTGNKDSWRSWGDVIAVEVAAVIASVKSLVQFVASRGTLDFGVLFDANMRGILEQVKKLRRELLIQANFEQIERLTAAAIAGRPGDRPDADKARSEAAARAAQRIQLQQRALEESTRANREELERQRRLDLVNLDQWERRSRDAVTAHRIAQEQILNEELANFRRFVTNKEDLVLRAAEIEQKRIKLLNEEVEAQQRIADEANKKRDQIELKANAAVLAIRDAQREAELERLKRDLDNQLITESAFLKRQLELVEEAFKDRQIHRDLELGQLTTSAEKKAELDVEKTKSEIDYTKNVEALTDRRNQARQREIVAGTPSIAPSGVAIPETIPINIGLPPPEGLRAAVAAASEAGGAFAGLGTIMADTFNLGKGGALAFAETLSAAFGQVASAVGDAVRSFVLFGSVEGGFRKFAAEVIASLAQMAVVQALYQFAQGLAWLALNFFFPNPRYAAAAGTAFASAAAFGAIAAVTVPLGRAVASNAFQQTVGGASGGSSGGGGSNTAGNTSQPATVELDRSTQNQQAITLLVNVTRDAGSIVDVVVDDHRSNGPIRKMILSER